MDVHLSHLNAAMVGVFGMLLFFYYLLMKSSRAAKSKLLPPEAAGAWPIIGHLHLLAGSELPHITLGAMADKYGPLFTIRTGIHRVLVVSNWEMAKECFTTNDTAILSRPKLVASKHLGYNYAMFGFTHHVSYWREVRKIATQELLSNRRLELLKHIRASEAKMSIKELYRVWEQKRNDDKGGVLVEMKKWFGDFTLNVVLRMVAGKQYFGTTAASDEKEARRCQKAMRDFFHLMGLFVVADALPFLGWLDLGGHVKAMKKTAKEIDSIASEWLEEHRRKRDSGGANINGEQDFMDVMLSILEGTEVSGFDADTINKATSMTMISGGTDTTTVTLTWALSLLLNNLHVLKKAKDELDLHIGKESLVNESDICKLVYLQAIVKETLRVYPPGPLGGMRQFTEDCTIGGYHIPEGTRLLVNIKKIQRDTRIWSDPSEFRPERFITDHKDVDVRGQHYELIPFSSGRMSCPGTSFGLQVMHLVLASLLHAFDISTPSNEPVDMSEIFGLTNIKATPLEVLVTPRLSFSIYE